MQFKSFNIFQISRTKLNSTQMKPRLMELSGIENKIWNGLWTFLM